MLSASKGQRAKPQGGSEDPHAPLCRVIILALPCHCRLAPAAACVHACVCDSERRHVCAGGC